MKSLVIFSYFSLLWLWVLVLIENLVIMGWLILSEI